MSPRLAVLVSPQIYVKPLRKVKYFLTGPDARLSREEIFNYHVNMENQTSRLIALALEEDFGEAGDVTSDAIFSDERVRGILMGKDDGVLAGAAVFADVFRAVDPGIRVEFHFSDGDPIIPGNEVATIEGGARSVLGGERTALNFLSFLSAIATKTRHFAEAAKQYGRTLVLDTRKTLPGYRALSKYAVRVGGGKNHRQGLYDMVLIKDNHIEAAGSLTAAVERVRRRWGARFQVETECRNLDEVRQALELNVDFIMLDNMGTDVLKESITLVGGSIPVEISGRVRLPDLARLASLGADFISVGALTHSVETFDFSLEIQGRT
jgi:nicotinate-nucleotide pyrophosphorylase (carboxylating)